MLATVIRRGQRLHRGEPDLAGIRNRAAALPVPLRRLGTYVHPAVIGEAFKNWPSSWTARLHRQGSNRLAPVVHERHGRFCDSDIFRQIFEGVVKACMVAGLVKGEGFAIDASVMEAEASRYHGKFIGARSDSKLMSKSEN